MKCIKSTILLVLLHVILVLCYKSTSTTTTKVNANETTYFNLVPRSKCINPAHYSYGLAAPANQNGCIVDYTNGFSYLFEYVGSPNQYKATFYAANTPCQGFPYGYKYYSEGDCVPLLGSPGVALSFEITNNGSFINPISDSVVLVGYSGNDCQTPVQHYSYYVQHYNIGNNFKVYCDHNKVPIIAECDAIGICKEYHLTQCFNYYNDAFNLVNIEGYCNN